MHFDVIVAGMGVHGLMTTYMLAQRGLKVIAVDPREVPHREGSSHGQTRVHRRAYYESPFYVPLLKRADELWQQFTEEWEFPVLKRTGVLMAGLDTGRIAAGAMVSAQQHGVDIEVLDSETTMQRWPGLRIPNDYVGVFEREGGVLQVEHVLQRLRRLATEAGATCLCGKGLAEWDIDFDGARVKLAGEKDWLRAERIVLATGPWIGGMAKFDLRLRTERQFQVQFRTTPGGAYTSGRFPAIAIDRGKRSMLYGIPDFGRGFKLAFHHGGNIDEPERLSAQVSEEEIDSLRVAAREWLPTLGGDVRDAWTCIYTNTADEHFILDRHPRNERVLILSCCSGHGFKFAPVVGEIACQLIADGGTPFDISMFSIERLRQA